MLKFKSILVPYDGSVHSARALDEAVGLAQNGDGTKLILLSVCNMVSAMGPASQLYLGAGSEMSKLSVEMEEQCRKDLEEAKSMVPEGVECETVLEIGSPGPMIVSLQKKYNADLIVIGSRGMGALKGILMGSVSSYVVKNAECPVMVAK